MTVYRTNGAWGSGLGVNLTAAQVDTNFYELRTDVDGLKNNPLTPNGIASITVAGTAMTVFLDNGKSLGPFPLPVLQFRWRDAWAAATLYAVLDAFKVDNQGIFSVLLAHTSAAAFNAAAVGPAETAGAFVVGRVYLIATIGTTDFTLIGASANTVGVEFTATGAGSGTGTATPKHYHQLIGAGSNAKLDDLSDVTIIAAADNDFIAWNAATGQWTNRTPAQVAALLGNYRLEAPASGATIALTANDTLLILNPAAPIAALTVTMAAGIDKHPVRIATRQRIDALTIAGTGGNSVDWVVNELPARGAIELLYVSTITTWVLI